MLVIVIEDVLCNPGEWLAYPATAGSLATTCPNRGVDRNIHMDPIAYAMGIDWDALFKG